MSKNYKIDGLTCEGCASTVKELFSKVTGVESVEVDVPTKTATVTGEYNEQALAESLSGTKYSLQ